MDINIKTFLTYFKSLLKLGVIANKGTSSVHFLDRCIKILKKYDDENDEKNIQKCLKSFNLTVKVTQSGNPVDVLNKQNQPIIMNFRGHNSLYSNNLQEMLDYCDAQNLEILNKLPLSFLLYTNKKFQTLMWDYVRALFFISQIVICNKSENINEQFKNTVNDESLQYLETILMSIADSEEKMEVNKLISEDPFLKLHFTQIEQEKIQKAKMDLQGFLSNKIGNDSPMLEIVNGLSNELMTADTDMKSPDMIPNMIKMAQKVFSDGNFDLERLMADSKKMFSALEDDMDNPNGSQLPLPQEMR